MRLADLACAYITERNSHRPLGRDLAFKSCEHLIDCARVYSRHLGRAATDHDLRAIPINRMLASLLEAGASPYTCKNRRTGLLILWRHAHRIGIAPECNGVRPVDCPPLAIDGYDVARMERLLAHVAKLKGIQRRTGVPRSLWWDSFLRADWESGLRSGDMLRVELSHFDPDGWLWCIESKTRKGGWLRLSTDAVASVTASIAANPNRKFIWPGYTRRNICRAFRELADGAGVGGTSRFIRRGGSSECDRLHPGQGWRFLRHSSPTVWEKHYRVDKIVGQDSPGPPPLT